MQRRQLLQLGFGIAVAVSVASCSNQPAEPVETPGLLERGTAVTTVKPTRQTLENKLSLKGKVVLNPIYGIESPAAGQIQYTNAQPPATVPAKPTRVATVNGEGNQRHNVDVPAGSSFAGRLVEDKSKVAAGTPLASAKYSGYAIVADINSAQAYKIAGALGSVIAQIQGGPGPFTCKVLGGIAALPAGTLPAPSVDTQNPAQTSPHGTSSGHSGDESKASDATGMRIVCTAPADVKMINGASATVELTTAVATNVLVLPVEAVAGAQGSGKVDIVNADGGRDTRNVILGITDGRMVEIKSGLTGEETVAIPGPIIPPPKDLPGDAGPGKFDPGAAK